MLEPNKQFIEERIRGIAHTSAGNAGRDAAAEDDMIQAAESVLVSKCAEAQYWHDMTELEFRRQRTGDAIVEINLAESALNEAYATLDIIEEMSARGLVFDKAKIFDALDAAEDAVMDSKLIWQNAWEAASAK